MMFGFALGAVVGVGLIVTKIRGRKDAVPFAPFLAAGATIAILASRPLLAWYGA
jgi:leader peptidase (prepilin peptidase)/N-methyltransferase